MPGSEYYDCPCGCGNHRDKCPTAKIRKKRKADHNPKPCWHQWSLDVESGLLFCRLCGIEKPTTITKPGTAIYACDRHREPLVPNKLKGVCPKCKEEMRQGRLKGWAENIKYIEGEILRHQKEITRLRNALSKQIQDLEELKNEA